MRTMGTPGENQFSCTCGLSSYVIHILVLSDGQILKSSCRPVLESGSKLISCRVRGDVGLGSVPEGRVTVEGKVLWPGSQYQGEHAAWLGATVKPRERGQAINGAEEGSQRSA